MSLVAHGTVVAAHGRHYEIALDDGRAITCFPRGKKSVHACGDRVAVEPTGGEQGIIVSTAPRSSLLYRSDAYRQKVIAANAGQVVLVTATEPGFSAALVSRCLAAAEHQQMRAIIVLNKADLAARLPEARERLRPFAAAGYPVLELSARLDAAPLVPLLAGRVTVFAGQSGMGKSTLINALVPGAGAATREISAALDSGRHTTTVTRLYRLDADTALIDSPGMQEFGLAHLLLGELEQTFVEFRPLLGHCRFRDCRHESEPDCALRRAVAEGSLDERRLAHFLDIVAELDAAEPY